MNSNIALTEYVGLLGGIDPASQAAGTYTTPAINTLNPGRLTFAINAGVLGGGGSLQFSLLAATASGGSYAAVSGLTACPAIAVSGNKVLYEVRAETLQSLGVGPWVKGQVVVAGATCAFAVEALGSHSRFLPMSDYNVAAVQAVVQN